MNNRRLATVLCFLIFILLGVAGSILGPTLQQLATSLGLPLENAGLLRSVRNIGTFAAILIGGRLLDRFDARLTTIPGGLIMAVGMIGTIVGSLPIALVSALLIGIGAAFIDIGPNYVIGSLYGAGASSILTMLHTFYGFGLSGGPEIVVLAESRGDWRLAYVIAAVAVTVMAIAFIAQKMPSSARKPESGTPAPSWLKSIRGIHWLALLPLIALITMYNGAGTGIGDWISTHMKLAVHTDSETAAQVAALYGAFLTGGRIISIFALRKFGNLAVLTVTTAMATVGAVLVVMGGAQAVVVTFGIILLGLGFAPVYPVVIAMGGNLQPEMRGTVIGILSAIAAIGGIVMPYVQGQIGGGQNGGMIVTLAATLVMVAAIVYMHVEKTPARDGGTV